MHFLLKSAGGNGSMKPSILRQHLHSSHSMYADDSNDNFRVKRARFRAGGTLPKHGFLPEQKMAVEVSYTVALKIAKAKKAHTIGEVLVKPCVLEMVRLMLGEEASRKIQQIPLSNDTIRMRIGDMSRDIREQVVMEIRASPARISLQLDESTDVSNCSQLLVFSRYIHKGNLKEDFLMCESLETTTKAIDVFEKLEAFFERNLLTWDNVGFLCTDGAPAMMGVKSGFTTLVKKKAPHVISTHCVLHRHALASKTLPHYLKFVLAKVVECVNYIRSRALNHRLFKTFCEELGSKYSVLLYHTEVRGLSRGHMLSRIFDLRVELEMFLRQKGSNLSELFLDSKFITAIAYLSDIFALLNQLNVGMQGTTVTILEAAEKLQAF